MGFSRQEYWTGVPLPSPLLRFKSWEIYLDFNSQGWRSLQTPGNYSPLESWLDSWFNFINLETFTKYHGVYPTWKRSREVDRFWPWRAYSRVCVCVCVCVCGGRGCMWRKTKHTQNNVREYHGGRVWRCGKTPQLNAKREFQTREFTLQRSKDGSKLAACWQEWSPENQTGAAGQFDSLEWLWVMSPGRGPSWSMAISPSNLGSCVNSLPFSSHLVCTTVATKPLAMEPALSLMKQWDELIWQIL